MGRMKTTLTVCLLLCLTACSAAGALGSAAGRSSGPVTTDPNGTSNLSPEAPNSLPGGFLTDHPLTSGTGTLNTVRVPGRP